MFDVITLGSATRDIFVKTDLKQKNNYLLMELGDKIEIEKPFMETGGGATNSAVSFSRLGLKAAAIIKLGNDGSGHLIKHTLEKEYVSRKFVLHDNNYGTALSIIMYKKNIDRTLFVYRGASSHILPKDVKLKKLKTNWLYITALNGDSLKILIPLLAHAKTNGIKVAMNPGAKELDMPYLLKYVDVLLLNKGEAEKLSGMRNNIIRCIKKLLHLGPKIIAVTDGPNLVNVFYNNFVYTAKPYDVKVMNTLGAGDSFCSAFTAGIMQNKTIEESIKLGLLNCSSVIQDFGAKTGLLYNINLNKYENKLGQKLKIKKSKL